MDKSCNKKKVFFVSLLCVLVASISFSLITFAVRWSGIFQELNELWGLIICYFVLSSLGELLAQYAKGQEKVFELGVAGLLSTTITIISNILFLIVFKWRMKGFLLATVLALFVTNLYYAIRLKIWRDIKCQGTDISLMKNMLKYCLPLLFTVVAWWVNSSSDKYIVTIMCGVAVNGVLSVAYKIPSILNTLQGIFIQAWQISAIKEYGNEEQTQFYGDTFGFTNLLMCIACASLIFLTKPLANILYAKDFFIAWQYVPFLLLSSVFNSASGFLGPILAAKKDTKSMALSALYGAIVNIILNVVLVYAIGAQGVTIATMIASFVIYQVRKNAVGDDIIIDHNKMVLITWILLIVQAFIEVFTPMRWLEIILMGTIMFINIDKFKAVLKSTGKVYRNENSSDNANKNDK